MKCVFLAFAFFVSCSTFLLDTWSAEKHHAIGTFLKFYMEKQSENFCPFTFANVHKLPLDFYADIDILHWQSSSKSKSPMLPYKITSYPQTIEHTPGNRNRKLEIKKFMLFCETFVSYIPDDGHYVQQYSQPQPQPASESREQNQSLSGNRIQVYRNKMQSILKLGKPARDRFIIFVDNQKATQIISESCEFGKLRFVQAVDISTTIVVFKTSKSQMVYASRFNPSSSKLNEISKYSLDEINLNGEHLRIAAIPLRPWLRVNKAGIPDGGLLHYWYRETSRNFNYTYEMKVPKDLKLGTGQLLENGTWIGMLGEISSGRADLASAAGITTERLEGPFEFTEYNFAFAGMFITAHPEIVVRWGTLVHPFTPRVWLLILVAFLLLIPIIYWHFKFELYLEQRRSKRKSQDCSTNASNVNHDFIYNSVLIPFTLFIEQDPKKVIPKNLRFLITIWMLYVIVLNTGYKEKLFSFMTFPQCSQIPQDLLQLAIRTDYKILYNYWPSIMYQGWMSNNLPHMKAIFQRFQLENNSAQCVVQAAVQPKTVCIAYDFDLLPSMASNLTFGPSFKPVFVTSQSFFPGYNAMPFSKGSLYVDSWRKIGSMMRDFGLPPFWLQRILKDRRHAGQQWLLKNQNYRENHQNYTDGDIEEDQDTNAIRVWEKLSEFREAQKKKARPMKVDNFLTLFALYGILCLLSTCVFLWERQMHLRQRGENDEKSNFVNASTTNFFIVKISQPN